MLLKRKIKSKLWQKKWAYRHIELKPKYHALGYIPKQNTATTKAPNTTEN